ncbi:MAG: Bacilysin biosynthesis protein BacB [Candidatus Anoxychlamydiales bacterium]|nr:Bacilysin biosynthesis protein BacB [Candidatus Anoxychlamydiales bacterium]
MYFSNFAEMEFKKKKEGIFFKSITGDKIQLAYIKLKPNQITNHSHINEQMGYIISGKVELTIGEEKKICSAGMAYFIPSNIQHGFRVLSDEDLEYIEIFSPPKKEAKI